MSAPVDAPIATNPAMTAPESQRRRGPALCSIAADDSTTCTSSVHLDGSPISGLFAARPCEKDHTRRDQKVQAATHPHQQAAKLLVFERTQRADPRRLHVRRVVRAG